MKKLCAFLTAACAAVGFSVNAEVVGYAHQMEISVTGYSGTETLVNFPMLVRLCDAIDGFKYAEILSENGADLRFTLEDGTELVHEIEEWNEDGTSFVWVKVPALTPGMKFIMYWGKADDVSPEGSVFADADYWTVLHLNEGGGTYEDATGSGNSGAATSTTVDGMTFTPTSTDGIIGKAVHLIGSELAQNTKSPSVRIANWKTQTTITDTFTISGWFRYRAVGQNVADDVFFASRQCRIETSYNAAQAIKIMDPGCNWVSVNIGGSTLPGPINNGNWYHIVASFSGTEYKFYANGQLRKSGSLKAAMKHEGYAMGIGNNETNERPGFKGDVDDVRISGSVKSADWIAAEYAQAATGSKFLSIDIRHIYVVPPDTVGATLGTPPYDSWETAATNIADAVAANTDQLDVRIAPGLYPISERLQLNNPGVTYACIDKTTGAPVYGGAVIDAGCKTWTTSAVSLKGASMRGFMIVNATNTTDGAMGGGLYVAADADSSHFISDTVISNCCLSGGKGCGGGVYLAEGFYGSLTNCLVAGNAAAKGGGIYYWRANEDALTTHPTVIDCTFGSNQMNTNWGNGGAGYVAGIVFRGCLFEGNWVGAGLSSYAACLHLNGYVQVRDCLFIGNKYGSGTGASCIYNAAANNIVRGCVFTANADRAYMGSGLVEDSVFTNNNGVALYTSPNLRNCLVANNTDSGVWCNVIGTNRIENCTLVGNRGCGIQGSVEGERRVVIVNSIVTGNGLGKTVGQQYDFAGWKGKEDFIVSNSVVRSVYREGGIHDPSQDSNRWTYTAAQVKFTDAANGDYTLRRRSPCRDQGIPLGWMTEDATDLAGNPRVLKDGEPSADALPDLGCYENGEAAPGLLLLVR